ILVYQLQPHFEKLHLERLESVWGTFIINLGIVLLSIQIAFLLYIVYLYFRYKPVASVSDEALPTCTVLVPAYNEGKLVYETL
ncbi:hypothetical protein J0673_24800, partial [Vibrio sp. Vb2736]|nr:hypothetical protein [Vibrio sp. Vb2736]